MKEPLKSSAEQIRDGLTGTPPPNPPVQTPKLIGDETVVSPCRECGKDIRFTLPAACTTLRRFQMTPRICAACTPIVEARWQEEERERERQDAMERRRQREGEWLKLCPPLYRVPDDGRTPPEFSEALHAWQNGPMGLAFCGKQTGLGKTWAMFQLVHRLFVVEGRRAAYLTASEFSHKVSRLSADKMAALDEFINDLCRVPILFLDDVGKGRMTDRVESELYHVIEERTKNLRPILFTSNAGGSDLANMLSEDRGEPIVRRLGEFCQIIKL